MKGQEHQKEILTNFVKAMKHENHKKHKILFRFGNMSLIKVINQISFILF